MRKPHRLTVAGLVSLICAFTGATFFIVYLQVMRSVALRAYHVQGTGTVASTGTHFLVVEVLWLQVSLGISAVCWSFLAWRFLTDRWRVIGSWAFVMALAYLSWMHVMAMLVPFVGMSSDIQGHSLIMR
jgi:hypothetical protein